MRPDLRPDLSRFKVIHGDRVLNALELGTVDFGDDFNTERWSKTTIKPKFIEVLAINEDGNIVLIYDEAWRFQFVPIIGGERRE
jgi:hypothetical protein